jgi:hypothetical protein
VAIEEKLSAEEADWDREKHRLKAALRRTADYSAGRSERED